MTTTEQMGERLVALNDKAVGDGQYVLYWMQQSQRAIFNHALEHAAARANELGLPLLVGFGLTATYPEANLRHYTFMLEGLTDVASALRRRRAAFVVRLGDPAEVALELAKAAACVVCDRGYLRHQKAWRQQVATGAACRVEQVEADVVVPVNVASDKREFAARTLRPKVMALTPEFIRPLRATTLRTAADTLRVRGESLDDIPRLLRRLELDTSVPAVTEYFRGGTSVARRIFRRFLSHAFRKYSANRNHPHTNDVSHMSKYLHFGQVSPVWLALSAQDARGRGAENVASFIEELVVRRELSMNWCEFTPNYDSYDALPRWARETLAEHRSDKRSHRYTREQLEAAETHDPYWNAAMREMRTTGYMHNYMRMYWGKKILEWTPSPQQAFATTLAINNKYFLDGRDANSYANVAWIFGLHDRPWGEREVFGKVRYMNARGLERKTDIGAYVEKVDRLAKPRKVDYS
jgi:deoxyribodipyrimidine photo-lyase